MNQKVGKRILVMTSVSIEREAVIRGLGDTDRFTVVIAGVGPAAAAANTAIAVMNGQYDLVVSAGIAGGFSNRTAVGSLVIADQIIAVDLGAETSEGFCSLDQLGFGETRVIVDDNLVDRVVTAIEATGLPVTKGPILSVSTVTGSYESAVELASRVPGAIAEAMEGYGVAIAAQQLGIPVLEIRAISNFVGPRDRTAWRIQEALETLQAASSILREVLE